ncbi:MAG TPA: transglutaminase domain-containing protein [Flavobacterium sp.]|nr:transglutaminase domain-containing protein [Flavobacterium sp.]
MKWITIKKRIKWLFLRHPLLYYIRFALICKNKKGNHPHLSAFNDINLKEDVHPLFFEVNNDIMLLPQMDEFEKAISIAIHLRKKIKGGRGLGYSSDKSLRYMLDGKGGVCSDFSQIFNVFCLINDVRVREWGAVDRFYKVRYGHTFNEIYSKRFKKWILIDIGKNIYFVDAEGIPLSVTKLFWSLRDGKPLKFRFFSGYRCIDMDRIDKIFSKKTVPFLIGNYNNKVYDYYLNKFQSYPPFLINALLITLRKNYKYIFVMDNYKAKLFPIFEKTSG